MNTVGHQRTTPGRSERATSVTSATSSRFLFSMASSKATTTKASVEPPAVISIIKNRSQECFHCWAVRLGTQGAVERVLVPGPRSFTWGLGWAPEFPGAVAACLMTHYAGAVESGRRKRALPSHHQHTWWPPTHGAHPLKLRAYPRLAVESLCWSTHMHFCHIYIYSDVLSRITYFTIFPIFFLNVFLCQKGAWHAVFPSLFPELLLEYAWDLVRESWWRIQMTPDVTAFWLNVCYTCSCHFDPSVAYVMAHIVWPVCVDGPLISYSLSCSGRSSAAPSCGWLLSSVEFFYGPPPQTWKKNKNKKLNLSPLLPELVFLSLS